MNPSRNILVESKVINGKITYIYEYEPMSPVNSVNTNVNTYVQPTVAEQCVASESNQKVKKDKRFRYHFKDYQIQTLEYFFEINNYMNKSDREILSKELDVPPKNLKFWFQNRRMRKKNQGKKQKTAEVSPVSPSASSSPNQMDLVSINDQQSNEISMSYNHFEYTQAEPIQSGASNNTHSFEPDIIEEVLPTKYIDFKDTKIKSEKDEFVVLYDLIGETASTVEYEEIFNPPMAQVVLTPSASSSPNQMDLVSINDQRSNEISMSYNHFEYTQAEPIQSSVSNNTYSFEPDIIEEVLPTKYIDLKDTKFKSEHDELVVLSDLIDGIASAAEIKIDPKFSKFNPSMAQVDLTNDEKFGLFEEYCLEQL